VDFSALGKAALRSGFDRLAFTSQAHFLIASGLDQLVSSMGDHGQERATTLQAIKRLTMPNEMGERFKVLALGKGINTAPSGFQLRQLSL
jgi:SAM-dependent MidA family methyltransferase